MSDNMKLTMVAASAVAALMLAACGGEPGQDADAARPAPPAETAGTAGTAGTAPVSATVTALHVYRLDCGTIEISDLDDFSTAGDYAGISDTFTDTCWLVRHPAGDLIWDLGLPGILAGNGEQTQGIYTVSMDTTLTAQLRELGLAPADIELMSISHSHFDHTGQVDQFAGTRWLVHEAEYALMFPEGASDVQFPGFAGLEAQPFTGELDVFGDGSVRIIEAPGHTPGHSVLLLDLPETGPLLLIGDLWHRRESVANGNVPRFNWDVLTPPDGVEPGAITRASMAKIEALVAETGARMVVQHEPADMVGLALSPEPIR